MHLSSKAIDALDHSIATIAVLITISKILTQYLQVRGRWDREIKKVEILASVFLVLSCIAVSFCTAIHIYVSNQHRKYNDTLFLLDSGERVAYSFTVECNRFNYIAFLLQTLTLWLLKGSYICTFLALSSDLHRGIKVTFHVLGFYTFFSYLTTLLTDLFWCGSPEGVYQYVSICSPYDITPFSIKLAMTLSTDLALFGLGIWIVHCLKVKLRAERLAIPLIFLVGLTSILASCMRYAMNYKFTATHDLNYIFSNGAVFQFWNRIECLSASVAYGLFIVRALIRQVLFAWGKNSKKAQGSRGTVGVKQGNFTNSENSFRKPEDVELGVIFGSRG